VAAYSVFVLAAIVVSFGMWSYLVHRDKRLAIIYLAALGGAFLGAKLIYFAAEGWIFATAPDRWLIWATGKSILGALLGGYAGVELAKKVLGFAQPTGDWFALVAPCGIALGRVGCLLHGCCLGKVCPPSWWTLRDVHGVSRWPAVPIEIAFNVVAVSCFVVFRGKRLFPGQHFHLYLVGYGLFRFLHEWMRDTPRVLFGLSGYHFAALAVLFLGIVGWIRRSRCALVYASGTLPISKRTLICLTLATFGLNRACGAEDLSDLLTPIRERYKVPAIAAAAARGDELIAIGATGVREQGTSAAVTIDDKWHIGSCTKSMTASLAAMFVQEGKLKWETRIGDVFPQFRAGMRDGWREVTLEQLLTHRSGAPGKAPEDLWVQARRSRGSAVDQRLGFVRGLLSKEPEAPPGTKFIYSNQGYAIAGAMIERVAGKPWEELLTARLFTPLGLKSAGFGAPGTPTRLDQPRGHLNHDGKIVVVPPGPGADNPAAIGPAGTVHCSIGDFARYGAWHAQEGRGNSLLREESFAKLHRPPEGQDYAMGWGVTQRGWAGGVTLTHSGSNTMWYTVIWLAPEKGVAFVAATNIAGRDAEKACDDAVAAVIKRVLKN